MAQKSLAQALSVETSKKVVFQRRRSHDEEVIKDETIYDRQNRVHYSLVVDYSHCCERPKKVLGIFSPVIWHLPKVTYSLSQKSLKLTWTALS